MTIPLGNSLRSYLKRKTQSLISLLWIFLSSVKAYSSFLRLNNLELILFINTLLLHGLNLRRSLYNISAKNDLNCLQNHLLESLFLWVFIAIFGCGNIFVQRRLFDHLNFPNIMSPGITVKTFAKQPGSLLRHRQPKLCGSWLEFEFIRECMKINKILPKFQFWTKIEIKMTHLVFVFCYLLSPRL